MIEKVRSWVKDHKKEIIIGAVAACGTALYIMSKDKNPRLRAGINITLDFFDKQEVYDSPKEIIRSNVSVYDSGLSINDLGKLGNVLKKRFPSMPSDTKLSAIHATYSDYRK